MRFQRVVRITQVIVIILIAITLVGIKPDLAEAQGPVIRIALSNDPITVDPNYIRSSGLDYATRFVINQIYERLFRYTSAGEIVPAGAIGYSVNGDVYTINLNPDAKWSDSEPVTAHHYVDGILRLGAPETDSEWAEYLYPIVGFQAYHEEQGGPGQVGIQAVDDYTLNITLADQTAYFPHLLASPWVIYPIRDEIGPCGPSSGPEDCVGNGPYKFQEWIAGDHITLVKNPEYWDAESVQIEEIQLPILPDLGVQLAAYESGALDVIDYPPQDQATILSNPDLSDEFHKVPWPGTYYIGLNTAQEHTGNLDMRIALASAIDRRDILVNEVEMPLRDIATSMIPPGMVGYLGTDIGYPFDVDVAQGHLEDYMLEAVIENAADIVIELRTNDAPFNQLVVEVVAQMWRDNLGVTVETYAMPSEAYRDLLDSCTPDPSGCTYNGYRLGWIIDHLDGWNILSDLYNRSLGATGWQDELYDNQLVTALGQPDDGVRAEIYRAAEKILVEDEAVVIPISHYDQTVLIKPNISFEFPMDGFAPHVMKWTFEWGVVTNTSDSGEGSLREAILNANTNPGTDLIQFNIPGPGPHTIQPLSALPPITDPVIIDGYSQPGASPATGESPASIMIELDGSLAEGNVHGLAIVAANSTVRGLAINGFDTFSMSGIILAGSGTTGNVIEGNYIGTDTDGATALGNYYGIQFIQGASNNTIGGLTYGARNVISGNMDTGVSVFGSNSTGNLILGNFLGTDYSGSVSIGNIYHGVWTESPGTIIGGEFIGAGNLISGNGSSGIVLNIGATGSTVKGNLIGTDVSGTLPLGNSGGIHIEYESDCVIGGTTPQARNIISGNDGPGININGNGSMRNLVQGNYIGTDISGMTPLGNSASGILLFDTPSNTIGGLSSGAGNVISGNVGEGVWINGPDASGNHVEGNFIGTDASGSGALGNGNRGVAIEWAPNNTVGGTTPGARNIISGNGTVQVSSGVAIAYTGATGNEVLGNFIGTDVNGEVAIGNSGAGVSIGIDAAGNTIGGSLLGAGNVISGNLLRGVTLMDSPANTIQANSISYNLGDGVWVEGSSATGNWITRNSIHTNAGMGIRHLSGGNLELDPPVIDYMWGDYIEGSAPMGSAVEIFADVNGEGQIFLGATSAIGGTFTFYLPDPLTLPNLTATATDNLGNTSEFSTPKPWVPDNCELNDSFTEACEASDIGFSLSSEGSFQSFISRPDDVDWFTFKIEPGIDVQPGAQVTIELSGLGGGELPANFDLVVLAEASEDHDTVPSPLQGVPLQGVPLQGVPLQGVPLQGVAAQDVPLQGVPLQGVDVGEIPLQGVPLQGVPLQGVPLQGVPLQGVPLQGVSFHQGRQTEEVTTLFRGGMTGVFYVLVWSSSGEYSVSPSNSPYEVTVTVDEVSAETCPTGLDRTELGLPMAEPLGNTTEPKTLILIQRPRMVALYGEDSTIDLVSDLQSLASHSAVEGLVVDLGAVEYTELDSEYINWDVNGCDPDAANLVTLEIKKIILTILADHPTIENLVIVGNDTIIPFRRVADGVVRTPDGATVPNEYDYQGEENGTKFIGSVGTENSPTLATLRLQYYLSDDFYADLAPLLLEHGRELSIPDIPIGRLVETPEDIQAYIQAFIDLGGMMGDPTITSLTTGYSFLIDQAGAIDEIFLAKGFDPHDTLISDSWTHDQLLEAYGIDPTGTVPTINSMNAHFDHWQLAPADYETLGDLIDTGDLPTPSDDLRGTLLFSVGCHSGLNFFDEDVLTAGQLGAFDWPQAMVGLGASMVGNWGFGYGDDAAIAYSEELMVDFARYLGVGNLGQALVEAKREYLLNQAELDPVHEKILMEAVFYGLPNWELGALVPTMPSGISSAFSTYYPNEDLTVRVYEVNVNTALRSEVTIPGRGSYYELADQTQAAIFRTIQPKASFDISGVMDEVAHGVLFTGGDYHDILNFDPVITMPTWTRTSLEPQFVYEGWDPPRFWSLMQLERGDGSYDERLAIVPGQFLVDKAATQAGGFTIGTERLYDTMNFEVFYAPDNAEFQPPIIGRVNASVSPNPGVFFSVEVRDPGAPDPPYGIFEVFVTYTEKEGGSSWNSFDLDFNTETERWEGILEIGDPINFFVQAVDYNGNVGMFAGNGYFKPIEIDLAGPDTAYAGQPVSFTATVSTMLTNPNFLWDFGDGIRVAGGPTIVHVFNPSTETAQYTVTVQVVDAVGNRGQSSTGITVGPPPTDLPGVFPKLSALTGIIGHLPDDFLRNPPDDRRETLIAKLTEVSEKILEGNYKGAINKLRNDILKKMDGCGMDPDKNDWVTDCGAQLQLQGLINSLIRDLEALLE